LDVVWQMKSGPEAGSLEFIFSLLFGDEHAS